MQPQHLFACFADELIYTVLNKDFRTADSLLNIVLVFVIFRGFSDNRCAVLEDSEEIIFSFLRVNGGILLAVHNKQAERLTCTHVEEVGVCADNRIVIFNIVIGVVGVGMLFLSGGHLLADS